MRWPFVMLSTVDLLKSRDDSAYRAAIMRAERAEKRAETADQRYEHLVVHLISLKREGFSPPQPSQPVTLPKSPPQILINAAREVSPVKDKTLEYNMDLIYANEHVWDDEDKRRMLAEQIRHGAVLP